MIEDYTLLVLEQITPFMSHPFGYYIPNTIIEKEHQELFNIINNKLMFNNEGKKYSEKEYNDFCTKFNQKIHLDEYDKFCIALNKVEKLLGENGIFQKYQASPRPDKDKLITQIIISGWFL
jgi:hypothetical protein